MQDDQEYWEFDFCDESTALHLNRRQFMLASGGGIFLLFNIGELAFLLEDGEARTGTALPTDFNAYLKIGEDGRVTCYSGKIEMGQGNMTSLAQMLADELDAVPERVDMLMGDTELCPYDRGTVGSQSIRSFGPALRKAGAQARRVLLEMAAERLGAAAEELTVENGVIINRSNTKSCVTYAELAQGKRIVRPLTGKADLKKPGEFKFMGKPALRKDAAPKVTGEAKYAGDIRLPGMLYARILRPPAHGAKLREADIAEAMKLPGVKIVREGDIIAALHKYPDAAEEALEKIKAKYERSEAGPDDVTIFEHLLKNAPEGRAVAKEGDPEKGRKEAKDIVDATYLDGYVAHAPMEPHTALAAMEGDGITLWVSTQAPFRDRDAVAAALNMPAEKVRVITPFVGGGFGGKSRNPQAVEAARLAKLSGKPVQVAWSRKEEFFNDTFRPAAVVKIDAGVNGQGRITFWDYHVYCAGERGAPQFYSIPHHRTMSYRAAGGSGGHPFGTGSWRAPGNNTNTFARESHIDSLAERAGIDPVEFRMRNLSDRKMLNVLKTAAENFGWKKAALPSGRGYGVACGLDAGTYVAALSEVEVNKKMGHVQVKRVVCVQDMGLSINPEGTLQQMEGCITMGLGYALKEHIRFSNGEILDLNFDSYDIPRFSWLPKIEASVLNDPGAVPQGGGEPAIVVMGAVIANAIYDAVGVRLRQLPLSPESIQAALKKG